MMNSFLPRLKVFNKIIVVLALLFLTLPDLSSLAQNEPRGTSRPIKRAEAGGKRGKLCPESPVPLVAFISEDGESLNSKPTFWFYVPYTSKELPVKFSLKDGNTRIHDQVIQLTGVPGLLGVQLPAKVLPLEINKSYSWFFEITCELNQPRVSVYGEIRHIKADAKLTQAMSIKNPQQRAAIYQENGRALDAFLTLTDLRLTKPNDEILQKQWVTLVQSLNLGLQPEKLEQIEKAPLILLRSQK